MVAMSNERVPLNTASEVNEAIYNQIEHRLAFYANHPELIEGRLQELAREWDVERVIETEAPTLTLLGLGLTLIGRRRGLLLSIFTQSMLLTHALQGYFPLLPLLRRMGFRTQAEIGIERYALKVLRGDFAGIENEQEQSKADRACQAASIAPQSPPEAS